MTEDQRERMPLGRIAIAEADRKVLHPEDLKEALDDHARGSWGGCDALERYENEQALRTGGSVGSEFCDRNGVRFLVVTEGSRTVTRVTVLEEDE